MMNFVLIAALLGAVLASAVLAIWGPDMTSYELRRGPTDAQWNPRFPATRPGVWSLTLRGGSASKGTMADDAGGTDGNCGGDIKQMVNRACSLWDDECDDEAAEELLQKALAIAPEDPDALCAYGVLLQEAREDYEGAKALFDRALRSDPGHLDTIHFYGNMLYSSQQDDEAEKMYTAFEKATEGWEQGQGGGVPHSLLVPTLCNHGALLERVKGDLDGAEALYKKALLIKPEDSATLYNYAVLLEDGRKDDAAALAMYERAIEADPEDVNALNNAALLLQNRLGHFGPAQDMFERAVKAAPSRVDVLCNYGLFLEDVRGDEQGAKEAYERALQEDEDDVVALCNLGGLLLKIGETALAEAKFRQAREIDEEVAAPLEELRREAAKSSKR